MKNKWIFIVFPSVVIALFISNFFGRRKEFKSSYHFKIDKIEVSATGYHSFYDNFGNNVAFLNYFIRKEDGVRVGDSISKEACAESLMVFHTDSLGKVHKIVEKKPAELFPRSWFCD